MIRWSDALAECQRSGQPHVLVSVISTEGSVPRNPGSKMLVTDNALIDTLGGGNLEWHALEYARQLLSERKNAQRLQKFPLAAVLGQCCGGNASLLFECFYHVSHSLWLFGAGHVGQALSKILQDLPLRLHWVDSRPEQFPAQLATDIIKHHPTDPTEVFSQINTNDSLLIMTHSHDQDYRLCEAALTQQHQGFIGLIGSDTKAARFRHRLRHAGFSSGEIGRIGCPVGVTGLGGKRPMEVAVSIAARVIQHYRSHQPEEGIHQGLSTAEQTELNTQLQETHNDTE
ncbi:hypothetical protein LH51_00105 [Nitrincola sp. A-D6]|uniref:xanthine dehydrogenase accessory protein XdhC n=1 Tax=Nitrincola sp. A-D6 TaxID=1545442 RepID=UPI00051FCA15|nr:xanthine dehydrogenase accessory protein XdhC [Nitrincola sp. A-D6]KGK43413.1 hypothetical protein LH51_00105 [Nitrincola sp. A-D6]